MSDTTGPATAMLRRDEQCPCGSGRGYGDCCGPILAGERPALTAEALMRSRYSAYVTGQIEYLGASLHPDHRQDLDVAATRRWAREASWLDLQVLETAGGGAEDLDGEVEFVARYKEKGVVKPHHERARFRKERDVWYYLDGQLVAPGTARTAGTKVGRNDPCPCGSGKKYKKCCGR